MAKQYNIEYIIDLLAREEDRLFMKLDSNLSGELLNDFHAYEAIRTNLQRFEKELNELKL